MAEPRENLESIPKESRKNRNATNQHIAWADAPINSRETGKSLIRLLQEYYKNPGKYG